MADIEEQEKQINELRRLRRMFHRHPETGFDCAWTSSKIKDELLGYGIQDIENVGVHSLLVTLDNEEGPAIGLRADFDALPITEENDVSYRSRQTGKMHACGHDGHSAMLLVTLRYLHEHREDWSGRVIGIFQEAEEGPLPGGASKIKDHAAIASLDYVFALHVSPDVPVGRIGAKKGAAMASVDIFDVNVRGKGGHAAYPEKAVNPINAAAEITTAVQSFHQSLMEGNEPVTLSVTKIQGGTTFNVIPETASITGTIRTFSKAMREQVQTTVETIVKDVQNKYRVTVDLDYKIGYPSVHNDSSAWSLMRKAVVDANGKEAFITMEEPMRVSEDFSYYAQKVPACIAWLGVAREGSENFPLHHPRFDFDERALSHGVEVLKNIVTQGEEENI